MFLRRAAPILVTAALFTPSSAEAQRPDDLCTEEIHRAEDARKEFDWAKMRNELAMCTMIPKALGMMGLAEEKLGLWVDAALHLEAALQRKDDPWVRTNLGYLKSTLTQVEKNIGYIEITVNIQDAKIRIDHEERGTAPLTRPIRTRTGSVDVEAEHEGYQKQSATVLVTSGKTVKLELKLPPAPPPIARLEIRADADGAQIKVAGKAVGRAPLEVEVPAGPVHVEATAPGRAPSARDLVAAGGKTEQVLFQLKPIPTSRACNQSTLFWTSAVGSGGALAVGAVLALALEGSYSSFQHDCQGGTLLRSTCEADASSLGDIRAAAWIFLAIGAAGGGAAYALYQDCDAVVEPGPQVSVSVNGMSVHF